MASVLAVASFWAASTGRAATPPPLRAKHAAVASDNAEASAAGLGVLKAGGNAIDAACATALALGVVHPFASGIGGGGFALVYVAKEHRVWALDFRERAPAGIRADMFVKNGKVDPKLSREGGLAVGVPGEVRGLGEMVRRFGKRPFGNCVVPAERLAQRAHVSWKLAELVAASAPPAAAPPAAASPTAASPTATSPTAASPTAASPTVPALVAAAPATPPAVGSKAAPLPGPPPGTKAPLAAKPPGAPVAPGPLNPPRDAFLAGLLGKGPLQEGDVFSRPDLALTLERLRLGGPDAFYKGDIAAAIVKAVQDAGGVLTRADLEKYYPTVRTPLEVPYRGFRVFAMPPPSSGGVALAETLGILAARYPNGADLTKLGRGSSAYLQVLTEALKHAFADRARHLGDPDFVKVPLDRLLSAAYHAELARRIKDGAVEAPETYGTPDAPAALHRDGGTTHLSVIDAEGNAVALTTTVNLGFGAHLVAGRTGIVLNDQMDDFAMQPGVPNGFGLIGSAQNAVAPGKRPLSSMTPVVVLDGADVVKLVVGAAGGPTIITATTQVLLNVVDWKLDAQAAIAAPRIHDQWFPDALLVEPEIPRDVTEALGRDGQKVKEVPHVGVSNLIVRTKDGLEAAAEPRSPSTPAGY